MKATLAALPILWLAPAADPVAEFAAKQKAALYDPAEAGLAASVVAFHTPDFKDQRLVVEEPGAGFTVEGVPPGEEETRREAMVAEWSRARRYIAPLRFRLADLLGKYQVQAIPAAATTVVTANRREQGGYDPAMIAGQFDARARLTRLEEIRTRGPGRTLTDFTWQPVGEKAVCTGYQSIEGGRKLVVTAEYAEASGSTLLSGVRVMIGDEPERLFAFEVRSVNGKPARWPAEGPFATPEATVKSFFAAAAAAKDPGMLAKCFGEDAEEEFTAIREHKLTAKDLDELAAMFGAGRVLSSATGEDGKSAVVRVAMKRGDRESEEEIALAPDEHGEWKITGF